MKHTNTRRGFTQNVMLNSFQHPLHFLHSNKVEILGSRIKTLRDAASGNAAVQDDSMIRTAKAFTLIELLVVVLIIGILAAVAVPQYQKAVNKAQIARWIPILSQLRRQLDLYVSTEGVFPILLEDIMFEPPQAGSYSENGNLWNSSDGEFGIRLATNSGGGVNNFSTRPSAVYEAQMCIFFYKKGRPYLCAPSQSPQNRISYYQPTKKIYCIGKESFCRALGVKKSWAERFDYWEQE